MPENVQPKPAIRLSFEYSDGTLRQTGAQKLNMILAPSQPTEGYEGQCGFWYELRDESNRVLFRRVAHDPMSAYHEVHSPSGTPRRTATRNRPITFDVVVPDLGPASHVAIFRSPQPDAVPAGDFNTEQARNAGPRTGNEAAREIARFDLRGAQK